MFNKKIFLFTAIILLVTACAPAGPSFMQRQQMELAEARAKSKISQDALNEMLEESNRSARAANEKLIIDIREETDRKLKEVQSKYRRERDEIKREQEAADILRKKPNAVIGMTTSKVRNETNWGSPNKINRTTTRNVVIEQWVYDSGQYLYFRNNKLYAVQN